MYVDVAFKGALQHARNWFPMHSRSSYVKKSNNAEAVEAACCCLRWRPSQCQRHLEHEERSLLPFFLPFFKAALLSKLYIVNKQLTQAKEAKNTSLHFLDAEKINQCNPILGQR